MSDRFWENTSLHDMTKEQWEALCDGCGLCCLVRFEDEDSGEIVTSNLACKFLDLETCRCKDYNSRHRNVPDCIAITPSTVAELEWLPSSCAYKKIAHGEPLEPWHYLICGDRERVHREGISWKDELISENDVNLEDYFDE